MERIEELHGWTRPGVTTIEREGAGGGDIHEGEAGPLKPAAERVRAAIAALGLKRSIIELAVAARTSHQAADALGVTVGQIAKSLVFTVNGRPLLVIASGANRVDEAKLAVLAGGRVRRADPETVKQATGYTIGGVSPLGHGAALPVYIDRDVFQYDLIYAAAGIPECVFPLTPEELVRGTAGQVVDVRQDPEQPGAGASAAEAPRQDA